MTCITLYYLFSVKQNVKDTFIEGNRKTEQLNESHILKPIGKAKL